VGAEKGGDIFPTDLEQIVCLLQVFLRQGRSGKRRQGKQHQEFRDECCIKTKSTQTLFSLLKDPHSPQKTATFTKTREESENSSFFP
jgi:hypothetical protein